MKPLARVSWTWERPQCIPCKKMAPILDELKEEYEGRLDVEFIDVWRIQMSQVSTALSPFPPRYSSMPPARSFTGMKDSLPRKTS